MNITITSKATHATTTVDGSAVSLSEPSVVELPIPHTQIKSLVRQGGDLIITTRDDQVIVVHGFFVDGQIGLNDFAAQGTDGLWLSSLETPPDDSNSKPSDAVTPVNPLDAPLDSSAAATDAGAAGAGADTDADAGAETASSTDTPVWLPIILAGIGIGVAAAASGSGNNSGGSTGQPVKPPATDGGTGQNTNDGTQSTPEPITNITKDNTLVGTLNNPLADGQTAQISLDGGKTWHDATVNGTQWTYDNTANPLPDGTYQVQVRVIDSTGTQTADPVVTQAVVLDTTATAETITITSTEPTVIGKTPSEPGQAVTAIAGLGATVIGTLSAPLADGSQSGVCAEVVQVSLDGGNTWANAIVNGVTWSYTSSWNYLLNVNITEVQARVVDLTGNVGQIATHPISTTDRPLITMDGITSSTGASAPDNFINDGMLVFNGSLSAPLPSGLAVQIKLLVDPMNNPSAGSPWINASVNGAEWTYDNTANPWTDGFYAVEMRIIDSTGAQIGHTNSRAVVVDTVAPDETVTITSATPLGISPDTTVIGTVSAPLANGIQPGVSTEVVQVSLDGGNTWANATVSGTSWSYTCPSLPANASEVQARVVDLAGNIGPASDPWDFALVEHTSAWLTQPVSEANNAVYYAGDSGGAAPIENGVDLIATGSAIGNNAWVHGVGADTTDKPHLVGTHDQVRGGAGNDHIGIIDTNFNNLQGSYGWDTLAFEASDMTLNLSEIGLGVRGFEQFDLNNQLNQIDPAVSDPRGLFTSTTTGNTLILSLSDILNQSLSASSQNMTILGDDTSTVELTGANWAATGNTQVVGGVTFDVWWSATMNTAADLLIQQGVVVHVV